MMQLIIAGTADQAAQLAKSRGMRPADYCYVYSPRQLSQTRDKQVWATGTYYARNNWTELKQTLDARGHTLVFRHIGAEL